VILMLKLLLTEIDTGDQYTNLTATDLYKSISFPLSKRKILAFVAFRIILSLVGKRLNDYSETKKDFIEAEQHRNSPTSKATAHIHLDVQKRWCEYRRLP
jgi:hypothetical protein